MIKKTKKQIYESEILKVIKANNLFVISDIFAYYTGIKSSQFYNLELEKSENIKKAIDDNKIKTRQSLKNKWYKSENPTLQIALFKTICSDEEAHRLNGSKQEIRSEVTNTNPMQLTPEVARAILGQIEDDI